MKVLRCTYIQIILDYYVLCNCCLKKKKLNAYNIMSFCITRKSIKNMSKRNVLVDNKSAI